MTPVQKLSSADRRFWRFGEKPVPPTVVANVSRGTLYSGNVYVWAAEALSCGNGHSNGTHITGFKRRPCPHPPFAIYDRWATQYDTDANRTRDVNAEVLRNGGTLYLAELHPYRQFGGTQAHFEDEATGERVVIDAFTHPVVDFVSAAIDAGFSVRRMGEWHGPEDDVPRLASIRFEA